MRVSAGTRTFKLSCRWPPWQNVESDRPHSASCTALRLHAVHKSCVSGARGPRGAYACSMFVVTEAREVRTQNASGNGRAFSHSRLHSTHAHLCPSMHRQTRKRTHCLSTSEASRRCHARDFCRQQPEHRAAHAPLAHTPEPRQPAIGCVCAHPNTAKAPPGGREPPLSRTAPLAAQRHAQRPTLIQARRGRRPPHAGRAHPANGCPKGC